MGTAARLSGPEVRKGAAIACEIAAFSALGASLAFLMWALIEPVGALSSTAGTLPTADRIEKLNERLAQLPPISMGGSGAAAPAQLASGFVLHATRAGDGGSGTAILSVNGAPQAAFSAGDEVVPGARLIFVAADHVEIDTGAQRLRVEFSDGQPAHAGERTAALAEARPAPANPLVNSLPLQSVSRPGGRSGLAVMPQADLGNLGASGLQPGDVLLKVDGVDISAANLASYAAQIQSGRTLELVFERNGRIRNTRIGKPAQ